MSFKSSSRKSMCDLKRPELRGEFHCVSCSRTFSHAASLKTHRKRFHGSEQTCLICNQALSAHETIHDHLKTHGINYKVFTCACCNWTFESKDYLYNHLRSIRNLGHPGDNKPLAISCHAPGSMLRLGKQKEGIAQEPNNGWKTEDFSSSHTSGSSVEIKQEVANGEPPKQLTIADLSFSLISTQNPGQVLSDAIAKLSALKSTAPMVDTYENAIVYVLANIQFTNDQVTNPFVWHHIIETATKLIGQ